MSIEKNVLFIRKLFEEHINKDDLSSYGDFFSPDVIVHGPASQQTVKGLKKAQQIDSTYTSKYPGKTFLIKEIFGRDDRVFVDWVCQGKHQKKTKDLPLTDSPFSIRGFSIYRIHMGKIVEVWQHWDRLGILEQLGEVSVKTLVEPGYYLELLRGLGMEQYVEKGFFLSPREKECLRCLLEGKTAKETAAIYKLSSRTVESHFEKIKHKLKCTNKRDLFPIAQILEKLDLL